jgi:multidrug efflux pump
MRWEDAVEAIVLVFLVMYLFLQNFRATLIPTIAVPVVLLGTFGVLSAFGYSINTLTMFGMVLAIGLLVDDAIVVVENVERVMDEDKLSPKEATRRSMTEITGALVGIALVLTAVFLPMAFFSGSTGVIYRQFSITIVSAMSLSVLVALIFTPSLCATILRPRVAEAHERERGLFGWFNRGFASVNRGYARGLAHVSSRTGRYLLVYLAIVLAMGVLFVRVPRSFLPDEDQHSCSCRCRRRVAASESTQRALNEERSYFLKDEQALVSGVFTVNGFSFGGHGQNAGLVFVRLKDWSDRPGKKNSVFALVARANQRFHQLRGAIVVAFAPPAALELGNATGFDFELEDRGNIGHQVLMQARGQLMGIASKEPSIGLIRPNGLDDEPQYQLDIDWEKASALGVSIGNINDTLGAGWGSSFVNQFVDHNRVKRVFLQGTASSRMLPQDLERWYVRNGAGQMVPVSTFAAAHWTVGSPKLERYNGTPSLEFLGGPAPGRSTGDALAAMEAAVAKLPKGVGYEWTGLSFEEKRSGSQAPALYVISLTVVFLCLAALYESWSIPFSVMLVVPLGIIGTIAATFDSADSLTMSSSRWVCSPRSASRPRTPS